MIRSIRFTLGSTGIVVGILGACTKRDRNQQMNQSIELVARSEDGNTVSASSKVWALWTLLRMAEIQPKQQVNENTVLEFVTGSRVGGIWARPMVCWFQGLFGARW